MAGAKTHKMKIILLALFGFLLGGFAGGFVGVGIGMIWIGVFQTSCFEGTCGMLMFYTFMPLGIIGGGLIGAGLLSYVGTRGES